MQLHNFPSYCGGTILEGLFTNHRSDMSDRVLAIVASSEITKVNNNYRTSYGGCYCPSNRIHFMMMLHDLLTYRARAGLGTIFAVTNSSQEFSAAFLEEAGFTMVATNNKNSGSYGSQCKSWVGDWHKDVKNRLEEILSEYVKQGQYYLLFADMQSGIREWSNKTDEEFTPRWKKKKVVVEEPVVEKPEVVAEDYSEPLSVLLKKAYNDVVAQDSEPVRVRKAAATTTAKKTAVKKAVSSAKKTTAVKKASAVKKPAVKKAVTTTRVRKAKVE